MLTAIIIAEEGSENEPKARALIYSPVLETFVPSSPSVRI